MVEQPEDPYELLGVKPTATPAQIRRAYRRLIVLSHRNRVLRLVERMAELRVAYETLADPARRRQHDATQREERARSFAASLDAAAPDSSDGRRRETHLRAKMAREIDSLSRQRSAEALAATSESMRALAHEHDEREAAAARRRAWRELLHKALRGAAWTALFVVALLAARLVAGSR